ncbi:glycine--tRNA ligase subunit beta [Fervidobacterium sp.]
MAIDFLFELGTEEIPHHYLTKAEEDFRNLFIEFFKTNGLNYESITSFSTPRRLSILVKCLEEKQKDRKILKKGPAKALAFNDDGTPTKALEGFLKSVGVPLNDIKTIKEGEKEFVYYEGIEKGKSTKELLKEGIPNIIATLKFPKTMKWSDIGYSFVRPIRWIVCVLGEEILDIEIARIKSSNVSKGHRFIGEDIVISVPKDYEKLLEERGKVVPSSQKRKQIIEEQVNIISKSLGVEPLLTNTLLDELINLTEYPQCCIGSFNSDFLSIPHEIIISEMIDHQKFIPLKKDGKLINQFIIVANTIPNENIIRGNQKVISARLNDGKFLFEEDLKKSIDYFVNKTKELIFFAGLGTMFDKSNRMKELSSIICDALNIEEEKDNIIRASYLSKFDLTTGVVYEFPELQGIMGYYYAKHFGENEEVANYIKEHYKPVSQDDELPSTLGASIVSIVDKLDNLFALYSAGKKVSGSSDPYALRRQVNGIARISIKYSLDLDIIKIFESAKHIYSDLLKKPYEEVYNDIENFVIGRLKTHLKDMGFDTDEVESTIRKTANPLDAYRRVKAINSFRKRNEFIDVAILFKRIRNILNDANFSSPTELDQKLMIPEELNLKKLIDSKRSSIESKMKGKDYEGVLNELLSFKNPVHSFFEKVFVMDENKKIRNNRLSLLYELYKMFDEFVDFNALRFE